MARSPVATIRNIRVVALKLRGRFTSQDIADACGVCRGTARVHLESMVIAGELNRVGLTYEVRKKAGSGVIAGRIEIGNGLAGWGGWGRLG